MLFKRRPKKISGILLSRSQAFSARPLAVKTLGRKPLTQGGQRIIIAMQPRGAQKWLLRMPADTTRRIDLDAIGIEVFDMCDGKTSVRQIIKRFAKTYQVDDQEAEMAIVNFIRMMMRKGLICLTVNKT